MISRTFADISEKEFQEIDLFDFSRYPQWGANNTWDDLLKSRRIIIISEAGSGKTYECCTLASRLWDDGQPAFFVKLDVLADADLLELLEQEKTERFNDWLADGATMATFCLDSIDELKLTARSFEATIIKFKAHIKDHLDRTRIIFTTRPTSSDIKLIEKHFPIPSKIETKESTRREQLADLMMGRKRAAQKNIEPTAPDWRYVKLDPLSDEQILEVAISKKVLNPDRFIEELQRHDSMNFAGRPQDLLNLCSFWNAEQKIGSYLEQIESYVKINLRPNQDRKEPAEVSYDKVLNGVMGLALEAHLQGRFLFQYSGELSSSNDLRAINVEDVLTDWNPDQIIALMQRPIFGPATYGHVKFHHRSISEYLAAECLLKLAKDGMSIRKLRHLLFVEIGSDVWVRGSMRAIAAWIGGVTEGKSGRIHELLRDNDPAVLMSEGDPELLIPYHRAQILDAYAKRYARGGQRGTEGISDVQIKRFATDDLSVKIKEIWGKGIENTKVRQTCLKLIDAGQMQSCADIAFDVAYAAATPHVERVMGLRALQTIDDDRLAMIVDEIAANISRWPSRLAASAILLLFPKTMTIDQLTKTLGWVTKEDRVFFDQISWQLPQLINSLPFEMELIIQLRDALVSLISKSLIWQDDNVRSDKFYLGEALAVTCLQGLEKRIDNTWLHASALAVHVENITYESREWRKKLFDKLLNMDAQNLEQLFWVDDSLHQSLFPQENSWQRCYRNIFINLQFRSRVTKDLGWILNGIGDQKRNLDERKVLLELALHVPHDTSSENESIENLRGATANQPELLARMEDWFRPDSGLEDYNRQREQDIEQEQKEDQQAHQSWVNFWEKFGHSPEDTLRSDSQKNTLSDLWIIMKEEEDNDSAGSAWNRQALEKYFDTETIGLIRRELMKLWREFIPTLESERPEDKRNTTTRIWEIGLAGIDAESEDRSWAKQLNKNEAIIATRYVPIQLNHLPIWMEDLVKAHSKDVVDVLGSELIWQLEQPFADNMLSKLRDSPICAKIFIPTLLQWVDNEQDIHYEDCIRYTQVWELILKHGDANAHMRLKKIAQTRINQTFSKELARAWLPALMSLDPCQGVDALAGLVKNIDPCRDSEAVMIFAKIHGHFGELNDAYGKPFAPTLLARLTKLTYQHVRVSDDFERQQVYTPEARDNSQEWRGRIFNALLDAPGVDGMMAKQEFAEDADFSDLREYILERAVQKRVEEINTNMIAETQGIIFKDNTSIVPTTNETMFAIMKERIADIDEWLRYDRSPLKMWQTIERESYFRNEIARQIEDAAGNTLSVTMEDPTAQENRTDIRLISNKHPYIEGVLELKIADKLSATELRKAISDQLVRKYLQPENRKVGALLFIVKEQKEWKNPNTKVMFDLGGLVKYLQQEAKKIEIEHHNGLLLYVHALDIRESKNANRGN